MERTYEDTTEFVKRYRNSKSLIVLLVGFALFLDNVLLTAIVPIMPEYLYNLEHPDEAVDLMFSQILAPNETLISTGGATLPEFISVFVNYTTSIKSWSPKFVPSASERERKRHKDLQHETIEIGLLLASKPLVQLITIPIIGVAMSKVSCILLILAGFLIMFVSTLIFAFGNSYTVLFVARSIQGVGSACSSLAGICLIAEVFQDDEGRGNAMAYSLCGIALGTLIGPTYGGVVYELFGKTEPFVVLAFLSLLGAFFLLVIKVPSMEKQKMEMKSIVSVISDPSILLACVAIALANMGLALLEPTLPVWMMDTMQARRWQQGAVFLPDSICYLICTYFIGAWSNRFGRWIVSLVGFIILGISYLILPLSRSFSQTIIPMMMLGFSIGLIDGSMTPELGRLADIRHSAVYGAVYALEEITVCFGNMIAPAFSGLLVNTFEFEWTSIGIALACFLYAPCMYILRNPSTKEEKKVNMNFPQINVLIDTLGRKENADVE